MVVCVCNNLNERKVNESIAHGACSPLAVLDYHGCTFQCGKCATTIKQMLGAKR